MNKVQAPKKTLKNVKAQKSVTKVAKRTMKTAKKVATKKVAPVTIAKRNMALPAFNPTDPLNLNARLTDEERMIRDAAHDFAQSELMPVVTEMYLKESFDPKLMKKMGEVGLLGPQIDGYGCSGVSSTAYGLIAREIERVDSGFRSAMSVQSSLVMHPIHAYANDKLKNKFLPDLAKGDIIGAFGLTEPNHGSNPGGMETRARKDGDSYILNGTKTWITNSPHADVFIIWARDDSEEITGFLVERGFGGVSTPKIPGKLSLRASDTGMIVMEDVRVPAENKLNVKTLKGPFSCLNSARLGIAWGVIGAAEACADVAREYSMDRIQFGRPLAANQATQLKLADMSTNIAYMQHAALQTSRLKEDGQVSPDQILLVKRGNCKKSLDIAREARDMLGGNGITAEYHVMRHMCNLETTKTYEGAETTLGLAIGRAITGINAFH
jgi:glutaryl-CoA dehydrogenase